jgi:hypothetical protein
MRLMRAVALAALALFPTQPAAPNPPVQACSVGFIDVTVVDSEGRSVPRATIELVAEAPADYPSHPYPARELTRQEADEIIGRGRPMSWQKDRCGNPLRQVARSTRVKRLFPRGSQKEFGVTNFGYCTTETLATLMLMKVSAPGYQTAYYLGPHLGGCSRDLRIVLIRAEAAPKKPPQTPLIPG